MWETRVQSLGKKDSLEKETSTHSSILAWRIQWTEEPGGPQSMGLRRVGRDCATNTYIHTHTHTDTHTHTHTHSLSPPSCLCLSPHLTPSLCSILIQAGRTSSPPHPLQLHNSHTTPATPLLLTPDPRNAFTASSKHPAGSSDSTDQHVLPLERAEGTQNGTRPGR